MKRIRKALGGIKTKLLFKSPLVNKQLAGVSLRVHKGTIRDQADQDDAWLFALMGNFDNIFDIGANVGLSSLFAKIQGTNKRILLVDPNPEALSKAAQNLITNSFSWNVTYIPAFVSNEMDKEVEFFTIGSGAAGSMYKGHAETAAVIGESIKVKTLTVDYLADRAKWVPDFVKIDVEGAEALVLEGACKLASEKKTVFMIEMHSPPELPMLENANLVLEWAHKMDYIVWYMKDHKVMSDAKIIAHRGKCHLLLTPNGTTYPKYLKEIAQGAQLPKII
jgi:FkbM family methyltransferase